MSFLDITINAPSEVPVNDTVDLSVKVTRSSWGATTVGQIKTVIYLSQIGAPPGQGWTNEIEKIEFIPSSTSKIYPIPFNMKAGGVLIEVRTYYWWYGEGAYRFDSMESSTINEGSSPECSNDNDCPEDETCENGKCVKVSSDWIEVARAEIGISAGAGFEDWVEVARANIRIDTKGSTPPPIPCDHDGDCQAGYVCRNGYCVLDITPDCTDDDDCPDGYVCKNGKCVKEGSILENVPWLWIGVGGTALIAAVLLASDKKRHTPISTKNKQ